jgi:hypothetical protein
MIAAPRHLQVVPDPSTKPPWTIMMFFTTAVDFCLCYWVFSYA